MRSQGNGSRQTCVEKYPLVFQKFEGIPKSRPDIDHKIDLIDPKGLTTLYKNGRIRHSVSAYGAPGFYVKQKDKLLLVFDYRALNKNTIKNVTALPNIQKIIG